MTSEGHLLFSISCIIFAKKINLTPIIAHSDWWHIIPSAMLTCLLPDIDHPRSFIGQRMKWISKFFFTTFGHRGFTHSLIAIFIIFLLFYFIEIENWILPKDVIQGMLVGYISHILADTLTPLGTPLFWPYRYRFRLPILVTKNKKHKLERVLCIFILISTLLMPRIYNKTMFLTIFLKNLTYYIYS